MESVVVCVYVMGDGYGLVLIDEQQQGAVRHFILSTSSPVDLLGSHDAGPWHSGGRPKPIFVG